VISGRLSRRSRLDTPLRLFSSFDRAIFAGYCTRVKMIVFAVACDQFGLEVATQLGEDAPQVADCRF
jgi:hypothetical protein